MGKRGAERKSTAEVDGSASAGEEATNNNRHGDAPDEKKRKKGNRAYDQRNDGEKEGRFLLGAPTFLDLGGGRFRCVETGHELPGKDREAYGLTRACRLALIDAAIAGKKPPLNMFEPHPICKSQLVCTLTGYTVNKTEEHIWKHISGKKFLNKLEQMENEKLNTVEIIEKDVKQSKKNSKEKMNTGKKDRKKSSEGNSSLIKRTNIDDGDLTNAEEPDFWVPPIGSRWDFDDGKDRWESNEKMEDEMVGVSGQEEMDQMDDPDSVELSMHGMKRTSIAVGPSSFASRKKKIKKSNKPSNQ